MEFYKVTDSEFLEKYRWSPAEIESFTCFEGGCHERAAYYLDCPLEGLAGFYCHPHGKPHVVYLKLNTSARR
jgi:hypothetical protein